MSHSADARQGYKRSHRWLGLCSLSEVMGFQQCPGLGRRPATHRFPLGEARLLSRDHLAFAPALRSLMNPKVKLEQVRGSFCLEIFGEMVTYLAL